MDADDGRPHGAIRPRRVGARRAAAGDHPRRVNPAGSRMGDPRDLRGARCGGPAPPRRPVRSG